MKKILKICLIASIILPMFASAEESPSPLYQEKLRPQFHITARQWEGNVPNPGRGKDGWLNDINGLVYYDGEYHAFAQRWATAWLHWVSKDLVNWTELKPAFCEERKWDGIQSGSSVIDKANSSGLGTGGSAAPMVAFYSSGIRKHPDGSTHATQCFAFSNDKGRTWTKYDKNPVLVDAERDPKVFWFEPDKKWIMVLYGPPGGYAFYSSKDLKDWQKMSFLPGYFECPDVFALPLDGDKNRMKWVVVNGDGSYVVGDFDGTTFKPETERKPSSGGDYYATQTVNNAEDADGRRIQLAWLRRSYYPHEVNYSPDMPFNQQMTFPCELTLKSNQGTMRLFRTPIKEVEKLHRAEHRFDSKTVAAGEVLKLGTGDAFHIKAELEMADGAEGEFHFRGETITVSNGKIGIRDGLPDPPYTDASKKTEVVSTEVRSRVMNFVEPKDSAGHNKQIPLKTLDILLDRTSVEVFANEGEASLTAGFIPAGDDALTFKCTKGEVKFRTLAVYEMDTIWKGKPVDP